VKHTNNAEDEQTLKQCSTKYRTTLVHSHAETLRSRPGVGK